MEWWFFALLQIIFINIILSGDNAIVIAMASRKLPETKRKLAVFWGTFGAIALRIILTVIAIQLLKIPYIMALGSLLLVWIAIKLIVNEEEHGNINASPNLNGVILTIIVADFVMSLDNVLAIASIAEGSLLLITIGIIISIPFIIWGSSFITDLLRKHPGLIYAGSAILGFTAGEMFLRDPIITQLLTDTHHLFYNFIPLFTALAVIMISFIMKTAKLYSR